MCFFFFFSSRRRHTRWPRDWSSDVCSSDLSGTLARETGNPAPRHVAELSRAGEAGQRLGGGIGEMEVVTAATIEYRQYQSAAAAAGESPCQGEVRGHLVDGGAHLRRCDRCSGTRRGW